MTMLGGIRVVSLNHFLLGPLSSQMLADLGADVISVESPAGSFQRKWASGDIWVDGESALFLCANRGKRSIAIDLKSDAGLKIVRELIRRADVVSENFRPGVMEKLGLGYDELKKDNPGLVFASASGYGRDGPLAAMPGQDLLAQAISGLVSVTGSDGARTAVGSTVVDHHGAALMTMGILAALVSRMQTGQGRRVDVDLLSAAIDLQTEPLTAYLNAATPPDTRAPGRVATWYHPAPYGIYPTLDGAIAISLGDLRDLAAAMNAPALAELDTETANREPRRVSETVAEAAALKPTAAWQEIFTTAGIWHAPVHDYADVAANAQVAHNGNIVDAEIASGKRIKLVGHPVKYDNARPSSRLGPQSLGAQTEEILRELGYEQPDIDRLFAENSVR